MILPRSSVQNSHRRVILYTPVTASNTNGLARYLQGAFWQTPGTLPF